MVKAWIIKLFHGANMCLGTGRSSQLISYLHQLMKRQYLIVVVRRDATDYLRNIEINVQTQTDILKKRAQQINQEI